MYKEDFLIEFKWKNLELIKGQLKPLFHITKALKGNADFKDGNYKASYSQLRELLLIFEYILTHFKNLTNQVENNKFNGHLGIVYLINEAWNKAKDYYNKINQSMA
jgi:hypothetical protein